MSSHILIPDIYYYGIAIILTCSIGCSNIASHVYSRWFFQNTYNVIRIQWLIKTVIILLGMLFINLFTLFSFDWLVQLISIPVAILLGFIAVRIELYINRIKYLRLKKHDFSQKPALMISQIIKNKTQHIASTMTMKKVQLRNVHECHASYNGQIMQCTQSDIILVAICEEIIYRGFLWQLALLLPYFSMTILAGFLSVVLFGASHLPMGREQFISKTILGIFCLLSVMMTQSILSAIIIHSVFNLVAYHKNSNS